MTSPRVLRGVPASGGVAAGVVRVLSRRASASGRATSSTLDLEGALELVALELERAADRLRDGGHTEEAEILLVGAMIARDPVLRDDAAREQEAGSDLADAISVATERHAATMESIPDPVLRERAADVRQVGRRAAALIAGAGDAAPGPAIIVSDELGPAEMVGLEEGEVVAGVAVRGGANSHATIVARTLGLPLVLGVDPSILELDDGVSLVVDGDGGIVTVDPSQDDLEQASRAMEEAATLRRALASERGLPAETIDGHRVTLLCNVATASETVAGLSAGAEGVGLLRTELTFLDASRWPDEDAHRAVLAPVLSLLSERRAVVRVLDFGGDKVPPFLAAELPVRAGPHARGLPALLSAKEALGAQLRAALDLGRKTHLGILVPMVTSLREVTIVRTILEAAAEEVGTAVPELGVMIEVPAAALLADRLAQELDFLAIGTNDLTEHVLGVNRRDPRAQPALAAHPSVIALINRVARAGREQGCAVRVCGEAGADPLVVPLLVGLGIESLSVSPGRIDEVRARVRRLSFETCSETAAEALTRGSVDEVWDLVRERCWPSLP